MQTATITDAFVDAADGTAIFTRVIVPPSSGEILGTIVFVHGFGGSADNMGANPPHPFLNSMFDQLIEARFRVFAYDHRCWGRSKGIRAYVPSVAYFLDDLEFLLNSPQFPFLQDREAPVILYGHSFGGQVVTNFGIELSNNLRHAHVSAIIASCPWYALAFEPPKWKLVIGRLIGNCLPRMKLPSGAKFEDFADRSPEELNALYEDGLGCKYVTAAVFFGCQDAAKRIVENASEMTLPFFLVHGQRDKICDWKTSEIVYQSVSSKIKSLQLIENGMHDMHNCVDNSEYCVSILNWTTEFVRSYAKGDKTVASPQEVEPLPFIAI
eukprot:ANDGO_03340.mRNA.1 putative abhydrolase domain-containing protein DDB_G0269086